MKYKIYEIIKNFYEIYINEYKKEIKEKIKELLYNNNDVVIRIYFEEIKSAIEAPLCVEIEREGDKLFLSHYYPGGEYEGTYYMSYILAEGEEYDLNDKDIDNLLDALPLYI